MEQIDLSEFKVGCVRLLEQVRQTGEPIEIPENGVSLAVVRPPAAPSRKASFGALKHSLTTPAGDLISPVDEADWELSVPVATALPSRRPAYGAMKHTLSGPLGDVVSPVEGTD